ncbi:MAG: hypothetical protein GX616_01665 [Planctomycetes bacterium]|nr:hypothetical protein [Planctomycetota bacterium]
MVIEQVLSITSWPMAVLGILVAAVVVTWPMYRRLVRQSNIAAAEGDSATALDAAMRLRRSWLPAAMIERILNPGHYEFLIATRLHQLGRVQEALDWCQRGLRIARRPRTKAFLSDRVATIRAWTGDVERCQQQLSVLAETLQKHPVPDLDWATTAISCEYHLGRLDVALRIAQEESRRRGGRVFDRELIATLQVLQSLGRHAEVLNLAEQLLEQTISESHSSPPEAQNPEAAVGMTRIRANYLCAIRAVPIVLAARSAMATGQRSLFQHYLSALDPGSPGERWVRAELAGLRAAWHAQNGDRQGVAAEQEAVDSLAEAYPDQRWFRAHACLHMAEPWQILGEHERAISLLSQIDPAILSPVGRSYLAAAMAKSLEALGQTAQAEAKREEARWLAPAAYWNRPPEAANESAAETVLPEITLPGETLTVRSTVEPLADQPVAPVASGMACAAWILAVPALIPLVGSLPAIALFVLSLILLAGSKRRLHDRRIGVAGLAISVFSLACAGLAGFNLAKMLLDRRQSDHAAAQVELPAAEQAELQETAAATSFALEAEKDRTGDIPKDEETKEFETTQEGAPTSRELEHQPQPIWHHVLVLAVLVVSIIFHEIAHGVAAWWSGDPTARDLGRINLNPIRHIDPFGSIVVPLVLSLLPGGTVIGWAKPVPVRPQKYRNYRRGNLGVSLAGVSLNLMLALFAANVLMVLIIVLGVVHPAERYFDPVALLLGRVHLPGVSCASLWVGGIRICTTAVLINLALANLNLLPLPPLDGFGALHSFLPNFASALANKLGGVGLIVLFFLLASRIGYILFAPTIVVGALLLLLVMFLGGWTI